MRRIALVLVVSLAFAEASPLKQIPLRPPPTFNPLHHLSAISPYFDSHPDASSEAPAGCVITRASMLIRHTSITANDDEYDETMRPLVEKLANHSGEVDFRAVPKLAFLANWTSPIGGSNLEEATDPGRADSRALGERSRKQYRALAPGKFDNFSIWTASSSRDIETAKAWIQGALPDHAGAGTGDGHVELVEVPNKDPDWAASLTPHKICPRFSKARGKPARDSFRRHFASASAQRLNKLLPKVEQQHSFEFSWQDIVGMMQLCGYETAIKGSSPLCAIFDEDEFEAFAFGEDLYYHIISGYGQPWVPAVGMPWLSLAARKLSQPHPPHGALTATKVSGTDLPKPTMPPEETNKHQNWNVYFTHREEPPVVVAALGLMNSSSSWAEWGVTQRLLHPARDDDSPASRCEDLDWNSVDWRGWRSKGKERLWRTSEIIPFLGHVALERLECVTRHLTRETPETASHVRVLVNETPYPVPDCHDGPGGSCPLDLFVRYVEARKQRFGDFEEACRSGDASSHTT